MSKSALKKWTIGGFIFVSIFGTLSHFMFHLFDHSTIIGLFVPVNESVWEHLKMLFWPLMFYSVVQYFWIGKKSENFLPGFVFGVLVGEIFIVLFFYAYNFILGKEILVLDVISFYLAVGLCQYINYKIQDTKKHLPKWVHLVSVILLLFMVTASTIFTFNPPKTNMFYDKNSKSYGINHKI